MYWRRLLSPWRRTPRTPWWPGAWQPARAEVGPSGRLYVAQAGTGDHTGKISEIQEPTSANPGVRDVVTGLLSIPGEAPGDTRRRRPLGARQRKHRGDHGRVGSVRRGLAGAPTRVQFNTAGQARDVANVGNFNYAWRALSTRTWRTGFPGLEPHARAAAPGGVYVADAGTNTPQLCGTRDLLHLHPGLLPR